MEYKIYEITGADVEYASFLADTIEKADENSGNKLILVEKQDLIGFLGELTFEKFLLENNVNYKYHYPVERPIHGSYDYLINNLRIDVKSEKLSSGEPGFDWKVYVRDYQIQQYLKDPIDILIFTVVNLSDLKSWILGYIRFDTFLDIARPVEKGYRDGGLEIKEACWILRARSLKPIEKLLDEIIT